MARFLVNIFIVALVMSLCVAENTFKKVPKYNLILCILKSVFILPIVLFLQIVVYDTENKIHFKH